MKHIYWPRLICAVNLLIFTGFTIAAVARGFWTDRADTLCALAAVFGLIAAGAGLVEYADDAVWGTRR